MPVGCAKSILISFNLILWLAGGTLIVLGTWIFVDPSKIHLFHFITSDDLNTDFGYYLAYILLSLGGFIFMSGLCGCCGAVRENRCLLVAYFGLLFVLMCIEITMAVVTFIYKDHFLSGLENRLSTGLIHRYGYKNSNEKFLSFSEAVDFAQYKFKCCGIKGDSDYLQSNWRNESKSDTERRNVPLTCCVMHDPGERLEQTRRFPYCLIELEQQQQLEQSIVRKLKLSKNAKLSDFHAVLVSALTYGHEIWPHVSNAGSPISVVTRVFYGTVEEPWQNPAVKDDLSCQDPNERVHVKARHKQGCINDIETWFKKETTILITVAISSAALQVIGMIFSICLCRSLLGDI